LSHFNACVTTDFSIVCFRERTGAAAAASTGRGRKRKGLAKALGVSLSLVGMLRPPGFGNLQGFVGYATSLLGLPLDLMVGVQNDGDSPEVSKCGRNDAVPASALGVLRLSVSCRWFTTEQVQTSCSVRIVVLWCTAWLRILLSLPCVDAVEGYVVTPFWLCAMRLFTDNGRGPRVPNPAPPAKDQVRHRPTVIGASARRSQLNSTIAVVMMPLQLQ
jgi:hypothetical protein